MSTPNSPACFRRMSADENDFSKAPITATRDRASSCQIRINDSLSGLRVTIAQRRLKYSRAGRPPWSGAAAQPKLDESSMQIPGRARLFQRLRDPEGPVRLFRGDSCQGAGLPDTRSRLRDRDRLRGNPRSAQEHGDFSAVIGAQGRPRRCPSSPKFGHHRHRWRRTGPQFLGGDLLVNYDGQHHTFSRSLLGRLFTPSRLKASEHFISELADQLVT